MLVAVEEGEGRSEKQILLPVGNQDGSFVDNQQSCSVAHQILGFALIVGVAVGQKLVCEVLIHLQNYYYSRLMQRKRQQYHMWLQAARQSSRRLGLSGRSLFLKRTLSKMVAFARVSQVVFMPLVFKAIRSFQSRTSLLLVRGGVRQMGCSFMRELFFLRYGVSCFIFLRVRQQMALNLSNLHPLTESSMIFASIFSERSMWSVTLLYTSGFSCLKLIQSLQAKFCERTNQFSIKSASFGRYLASTKIEAKSFVTLDEKQGCCLYRKAIIFFLRCQKDSPSKGSSAASIVQSVTPKLHTSTSSGSQGCLLRISGGLQEGVPQTVLLNFAYPSQQKPKSMSLAFHCSSKRMFSGLMSRWLSPQARRQASADRI